MLAECTEEQEHDADVEEEVFMQTWIPSHLDQVFRASDASLTCFWQIPSLCKLIWSGSEMRRASGKWRLRRRSKSGPISFTCCPRKVPSLINCRCVQYIFCFFSYALASPVHRGTIVTSPGTIFSSLFLKNIPLKRNLANLPKTPPVPKGPSTPKGFSLLKRSPSLKNSSSLKL